MSLFEMDYGLDNSPPDNTEIVQVILYFSQEETKEFKKLCKELMKREWPGEYIDKGNLSDLLLKILKKQHESGNIITKNDGETGGSPEGHVLNGKIVRQLDN